MPSYKIHKRKSMIDKDTTIVNVTKEKTLSETLFGENEKDKEALKEGTYTIHERNSILDKNEKIVSVTRQKPLSETLFESDDSKQKQEKTKENYSNYAAEQNQKMMNDYNDLLEMERKYTDQQRYNNKVVGEEHTEGISKTELNNAINTFDYASVSLDKKKDYLIFVAKLFNAIDKGYSVDYVKLEKKKVFSKEKIAYDGPKYWEIKKDESEYELNKGYRYEYNSVVIDENGELWNKYESVRPELNKYIRQSSFVKIENMEDIQVAFVDIALKRKKIDLSLEKYLNMDNVSRERLINEAQNNWTEDNNKLKESSKKRSNNLKFVTIYNKFMAISKLVLPLVSLLPILLVVIQTPLFLLIPFVIIISAVYGFIKESTVISAYTYTFSMIVTSILMLIRGYDKAFTYMLIMVGISIGIMYLMTFIESKVSEKVEKIELY